MHIEKLAAYYDSKLDEIKANYYLALKRNDPDGVHDLRVELKRLKAFFNLVESVNTSFMAKKRFADFKLIAKKIASLRDSQVQIELLSELKPRTRMDLFPGIGFPVFIKKKESEAINSFLEFTKTYPLENLNSMRKIILKALHEVPSDKAIAKATERFFYLKSELAKTVREDVIREQTLHKVRILTKETHYTLEILQKCFGLYEDAKIFVDEVKKTHQALGKWHDFEVGLVYINRYLVDDGAPFEECKILAVRYRSEKRRLVNQAKIAFANYQDHPEIFGEEMP